MSEKQDTKGWDMETAKNNKITNKLTLYQHIYIALFTQHFHYRALFFSQAAHGGFDGKIPLAAKRGAIAGCVCVSGWRMGTELGACTGLVRSLIP